MPSALDRQRRHDRIEPAVAEIGDEPVGERLLELYVDRRIPFAQVGNEPRYQIGRERRDNPEADPPLESARVCPGALLQSADIREDGAHLRQHFLALDGQENAGAAPFHQLHTQMFFHLHDLRRERRLADMGEFGRLAEVASGREGIEVTHLPECQHDRKILS